MGKLLTMNMSMRFNHLEVDSMAKIMISDSLNIGENEVQVTAIRAQGAGGQHVNKVSTAIHLRFDIRASSLNEESKLKLLSYQ